MDLIRHLRFFVTVAEEGHFGRAAAVFDMTQPLLSQGLRKLEQHLGSELVHRTRQGAVLTPAGTELLPRARLLVDDADRFLAEAGRVARARGLLHWGATRALPDRLITLCVTASSRRGRRPCRPAPRAPSNSSTPCARACAISPVVEHPALTEGLDAGPAVDDRAVLAAVAAGTHFGVSTSPPGSVPGVAWLDWAPSALTLRVRIVRRADADVGAHVDALDRVLLKERVR